MKLIDREKALKIAEDYGTMHGTIIGRHSGVADIIHYELEKLPTIEAEPLSHSKWISLNNSSHKYCESCGVGFNILAYERNDYRFCPSCGAKMEGGDEK